MTAKKGDLFIFRYFSNRGTDQKIAVLLKTGTTNKEALEEAKEWAERDTAGSCCYEYTVTVERAKALPRKEWLRQWKRECKAYDKAKESWENLRAIGHPYDWRNK